MAELRCRLCGAVLSTGLVATGRRACCLNATPIVGVCPTHGPLGPHHATESSASPPADASGSRTGVESDDIDDRP
jgi:hypothetical protein